jgi:hypothetical protein
MSRPLIVYPGETSPEPADLQTVLREQHEALSKARLLEIEQRKKGGIPLDDKTSWPAVEEAVSAASVAHGARDSVAVNAAALKLMQLTAGNALEPLPPYEDDPRLDGIRLIFRMPSQDDRLRWSSRMMKHIRAQRRCITEGDDDGLVEARLAYERVHIDQVVACVDRIDGIDGLKATVAESIEGLRNSQILVPIINAVTQFLELAPEKALRCGLPPLST